MAPYYQISNTGGGNPSNEPEQGSLGNYYNVQQQQQQQQQQQIPSMVINNNNTPEAQQQKHHLQQQQQQQQQIAHGPLPLQRQQTSALPPMQLQLLLAIAQQNPSMFQQPAVLAALQQQAAVAAAGVVTHNLIPEHLQQAAALVAYVHQQQATLAGQHQYQPALIHPGLIVPSSPSPFMLEQPVPAPALPPTRALTVQDRPMVPPVYNGVNLNYPGLILLNATPPVYAVEHFLTPLECDFLVAAANDSWSPAPVVGKGAGEISTSRTSSTCYLAREDLPDYMRKVSLLTGKPVEHCELPQVGRYLHTQQYLQHFDAFDLSNEDGQRFASNGGQRVVTVLVYLNDVPQGGATFFPALNLKVQPRRGMALVFFPATLDGLLDRNALHAALPAIEPFTKYVSQVWIRQGNYTGQPSKRLSHTLGVPFQQHHNVAMPGQQQQQQIPTL